jgi:hypothetical protein
MLIRILGRNRAQISLLQSDGARYALAMLPRRISASAGLLSLAFVSATVHLSAQTSLSIAPQDCVWQQGDDIRWAAPDLDESSWHPASTWSGIATPTPNFWLRCRFDPAQLAPAVVPELQVSGDLAWQVFAGGTLIGASGNMATGTHTMGLEEEYAAPELARSNGPIVVAMRMTFSPAINGLQVLPKLALGDAEYQRNAYFYRVYQNLKRERATWVCYALIASAGLFFLALYWFDRTQRYILWVSLVWLSLSDLRINEFLVRSSTHYPSRVQFFLYAIGQTVPLFITLFYFAVNGRRLPKVYLAIQWMYAFFPAALVTAAFLPLRASMETRYWVEVSYWPSTLNTVLTLSVISAAPAAFWPFRGLRGWQIPLACACLIQSLMDTAYMVVQLPVFHFDVGSMFLAIQPYRSAAIALVVVALTLLLVQRVRATNRERAALQGEMHAAREIQQYLIPEKLPPTPGLTIHSVYQPSREVGGDFFQVLPDSRDGSTLIVVGDVAGKGLKAGMLAALIVGAIRTAFKFTSDPSQILALLNERLQGRGLVTCLAMRIDHDGNAELANAGHLPPYVNGKELALDGALPLGALPDIAFPITRLRIKEGESMLLVSDGVVEARNAQGELFGFERTRNLSSQPANEIARAAQAFGQEDDITVLTLSLAPVGAVHA